MNTQQEINDEIEMLVNLVSLPIQPESVRWRVPRESNRDASNLIVLLHYSEADAETIIENSTALNIEVLQLPTALVESLLPEAVVKTLAIKKEGQTAKIGETKAYEPSAFTQTDYSPFVNGTVFDLGGGYLLLDLYSM